MRKIGTIQGCEIFEEEDGRVHFTADADVDCDGSGGNELDDPFFQADTTLHHDGKALNAELVPFIVVPKMVIVGVKGVVMGAQARVTNTHNNRSCLAVVGDLGPSRKIGEVSCQCARLLGLSGNPNIGGTDEHIILYEIWPGTPAVVDGVTYELQPHRV